VKYELVEACEHVSFCSYSALPVGCVFNQVISLAGLIMLSSKYMSNQLELLSYLCMIQRDEVQEWEYIGGLIGVKICSKNSQPLGLDYKGHVFELN